MKHKRATRYLGIILLLIILVALFSLMFSVTKKDDNRVGISGAATVNIPQNLQGSDTTVRILPKRIDTWKYNYYLVYEKKDETREFYGITDSGGLVGPFPSTDDSFWDNKGNPVSFYTSQDYWEKNIVPSSTLSVTIDSAGKIIITPISQGTNDKNSGSTPELRATGATTGGEKGNYIDRILDVQDRMTSDNPWVSGSEIGASSNIEYTVVDGKLVSRSKTDNNNMGVFNPATGEWETCPPELREKINIQILLKEGATYNPDELARLGLEKNKIVVEGDKVIFVDNDGKVTIKSKSDFKIDTIGGKTYYVADGKVYILSGNELKILSEKELEEYNAAKELAEEQKEKPKQEPQPGEKLGDFVLGENNKVYFFVDGQQVEIGDYENGLIKLSVDNPELKDKYLDPKSGIVYNNPNKKDKFASGVKVFENGNYKYIDKDGKKHYFKGGDHKEIIGKDIIMYTNGAYTYKTEDGKTVFVTEGRYILYDVKPDGAGGWFDKKGNHFMGDGTVFNKKDWTIGLDQDQDGNIESFREFSSCTHWGGRLVCHDKEGKVYDCTNFKCSEKELSEDEQKEMGAYGFLWFGNILDAWATGTSGYSGVSLLYDEPKPIVEFDEWFSNLLGGIDGWTSLICQYRTTDSADNGATFSPVPGGAYAHIEAEKLTTYSFDEANPQKIYFYKISFQVYGGSSSAGCDIHFKVRVKNDATKSLFKDSETGKGFVFKAKKGNNSISYAGNSMIFAQSKHDYNKVCIYFQDLIPKTVYYGGKAQNCLIGIEKDDELCSDIKDAGERVISIDNPCEDGLIGLFIPNCWEFGDGSGLGGTSSEGDEAEPEDEEQTEGTPVLDI